MGDFTPWAGAGAAILVAVGGGIFRLTYNHFKDDFRELDEKVNGLLEIVTNNVRLSQERHEENVQRLTRVETLVNGYNGTRRKRP